MTRIYLLIAFALAPWVYLYVAAQSRRTRLRRAVFNELNLAFEDGFFDKDGYLDNIPPDEIANRIVLHDNTLARRIAPYVREWMGTPRRLT